MEQVIPPPGSLGIDSFAQAKEIAGYWLFSTLSLRDGFTLSYATYIAAKPEKGHILLLPDCGEFVEKYSEVAENFARRGWQVTCLEWRGTARLNAPDTKEEEDEPTEGGSLSLPPELEEDGLSEVGATKPPPTDAPPRGDIPDWFNTSLADLEEFWKKVWRARGECREPSLVVGHGWGAHFALRWQADGAPEDFRKTAFILTAPVVSPPSFNVPLPIVYAVVRGISMFTLSLPYPGQTRAEADNDSFPTNRLTHDPIRYQIWRTWVSNHPRVRLAPHGWSWLAEAYRSAARLDEILHEGGMDMFSYATEILRDLWSAPFEDWRQRLRYFKEEYKKVIGVRLPLPHLVFLTPQDRVVDGRSQNRLLGRFKRGRLVTLAHAKHDVWQEGQKIQERIWKEIDDFMARCFR